MMHAEKTTTSHLKEEELSIFTKLEEEMVLKRAFKTERSITNNWNTPDLLVDFS